ncbi:suppressor of fused domain protein [Spirillospora sp. NPDC047279]|uniref:suppressor of fused domain protein n=1 Tax=Spirillospora sp. NPDC047279 TaxID=3155478 RepID=UPI0033F9BD38
MTLDAAAARAMDHVEDHVRAFFEGHPAVLADYDLGDGSRGTVPALRVIEVAPGPRLGIWTYATVGASLRADAHGRRREFVLTAAARDPRFPDLLAMAAFYHCGPAPRPLDVGHSVPLGEPWLLGSTCDHFLVSLPYLHGPALEQCTLPDGHQARFLWLLPVTPSEIAFRRTHGTEALEQLFDQARIDPVDPHRPAVV